MITGCGGTVIRDPEPVLLYRQHESNLIGANLSTGARLTRIRALLNGRFRDWNRQGLAALAPVVPQFSSEARICFDHYGTARKARLFSRLRALRASGVYRQGRLGTVALYLACLIGRL